MSLKLAEHYNFGEFDIKYVSMVEFASIYHPGLFCSLEHMAEFRDVFEDKQKFNEKVGSY